MNADQTLPATTDAITLEIVKNALGSIADEMALVVLRSAYSPIVRDSMDFSTAVFDREGRVIAQGLTLPIHLGAFPAAMRNVVNRYRDAGKPGDVYIMNDPYTSGGMHLPDVYLIQPVFFDERIEGYVATIVHHTDVGGMAPGSMAIGATEIFQEGLRIPLMKLVDGGEPNHTLLTLLETNSRMPDQLRGDLRAQIASCRAGARGLTQLFEKYGAVGFARLVDALHDYAERVTRQAIRAMPDGEYRYEDFIDGLGDEPKPIAFRVKVTIAGDEVSIDWAGTDGQVAGAINGPFATTQSVAYAAVRCAIGVDVPNCEGFSRAVSVLAERGSIVNPVEPAACAARGIMAYRMFDVLQGAFAQVVPDAIPALGEGGPSVISISGRARDGGNWLITDGILGSWGGGGRNDGSEGIANPLGNLSNQPVELIEARLPLKISNYGFVTDSGGAGKHRGGLAMRRTYQLMADHASLGLRSDRRAHRPTGSNGGLDGSPSLNVLSRDGVSTLLPSMPSSVTALTRGDAVCHIAAGGAGYGHPWERDAQAVLDDVLDERISERMAADVYGVLIDRQSARIDAAATETARAQLRTLSNETLRERQDREFSRSNGICATVADRL
ncbi:hydantoinase B/oxoprolinase family protein [Burkholderia cepacia]|uniref:hydantoinase B/oxoprolinase family protein n=1 Tax=Burkholderia cepacia TaxID=292 RepID=UPI00075EB860|nr:hydantoinase B/oxoprolinase family protein [Burkholderia cepacia]KVS61699.1 5-oxoprolinase [Burkholderia cepacia]